VTRNRSGYRPVDTNRARLSPPVDHNRPATDPFETRTARATGRRLATPQCRAVDRRSTRPRGWANAELEPWQPQLVRGRTGSRSYDGRRPGFWFDRGSVRPVGPQVVRL